MTKEEKKSEYIVTRAGVNIRKGANGKTAGKVVEMAVGDSLQLTPAQADGLKGKVVSAKSHALANRSNDELVDDRIDELKAELELASEALSESEGQAKSAILELAKAQGEIAELEKAAAKGA